MNTRQAGVKIKLEIPELKVKAQLTTDTEGKADFHIKSTPKCWSPESPQLYDVIITNGTEQIKDRIGFRQIETKGKNILLNGKKVFSEEYAFTKKPLTGKDGYIPVRKLKFY